MKIIQGLVFFTFFPFFLGESPPYGTLCVRVYYRNECLFVEIINARQSIFITTVSSWRKFSFLLIQFKLVYGLFGQSNKNSILDFCPRPVYDRSRIFDIRPKPKFSFKKIRPSAEDISQSRRYELKKDHVIGFGLGENFQP